MSTAFRPLANLIVIDGVIMGPNARTAVSLALDTGATYTIINRGPLITAGYSLSAARSQALITTGSGVIQAPRINVASLSALGQSRNQFPVLAHDLPPTSSVDGVLGLDFLRQRVLTIDFPAGQVTLA